VSPRHPHENEMCPIDDVPNIREVMKDAKVSHVQKYVCSILELQEAFWNTNPIGNINTITTNTIEFQLLFRRLQITFQLRGTIYDQEQYADNFHDVASDTASTVQVDRN
jgi:hypothetical protein